MLEMKHKIYNGLKSRRFRLQNMDGREKGGGRKVQGGRRRGTRDGQEAPELEKGHSSSARFHSGYASRSKSAETGTKPEAKGKGER